jgi:hypothetical protein
MDCLIPAIFRRRKNQKRLDDFNALRLSASLERKIVNMEPEAFV